MFNFWWSHEWSEQKMLTEMQKNEKGDLSHWKIKCLFLDYVQLLMIGRVIWAKNVDQNTKKWKRPPKSSKNKMFVFGLRSTSDDWPSNLSKKCWTKHKKIKMPPKSSKNKMFVFGLHSTSEDWPNDLSKKCWPRCKKNGKGPLSHQKIKCSFLDYVQLLMISQAIWAKNVDRNAKKWKRPPRSLKNKMFIFGLCSTSDDQPSDLSKKRWPKCKKIKKRLPKSSKNKMSVFGLHSTSDDQLSDLSKKHWPKHKKMKKAP